jgi:glutamate racemase
MGRHIRLIDSAQETAKEIMKILQERNLMNEGQKKGSLQFFVTDDPERFKTMGYRFLEIEIENVTRVETIR